MGMRDLSTGPGPGSYYAGNRSFSCRSCLMEQRRGDVNVRSEFTLSTEEIYSGIGKESL